MKTDIHPKYYKDAKAICACGAVYNFGNTVKEIKVDTCSACHPFYTGKKRILDSSGRVERFKQKMVHAHDFEQKKKEREEEKKKTVLDKIEEEKERQEKVKEEAQLKEMTIDTPSVAEKVVKDEKEEKKVKSKKKKK
ncbi:50S ribosomal protein L31 [Candidatus Peregrinibacteria bacterium RIFOXYB2_FULL_32_7]|nr:MAG: 50S ribosomal protein L31 [Candidatus Peregrinibacteria bacterium RIFOXYB2_FULL_32_7]